jgi:hypothetical protein
MTTKQEKLIFLHLHKTGGLSMNVILDRQFIGQRGAVIHSNSIERTRELAALPQQERDQFAYISGHFYYGIHEIWTSPASYFSLLREPIARAVSFYNFDGISRRAAEKPDRLQDLDSHMRALRQTTYYIRRIGGYKPGQPGVIYKEHEITPDELHALAESHLKQMKVVGLTEEFDRTLLLLRRAYGWHNLFYVRRNTTNKRRKTVTLSDQMRAEILPLYRYDSALYEQAKAIFAEQCRAYGNTLEEDLRVFQRNNALYGRIAAATERIRDTRLYGFIRRMTGNMLRD